MSSNALILSSLVPGANLQQYINTVNSFPVLTAERERELTRRLWKDNDLDAARELVLSHLRFVVHLSRSYEGYGVPQEDLIQEGNIGLMKAVNRFDPNRGARLATFAVHWIKAEMNDFIIRNWRIFKIATNRAQRKLFYNLRRQKEKIGQLNMLTSDETKLIAKDLGVRPDEVREMEERLTGQDITLDAPTTTRFEGDQTAHYSATDTLVDDEPDPAQNAEDEQWSAVLHQKLQDALEALDERSREIVYGRWISEQVRTLDDLGTEFGISAERVRQLEKRALLSLKEHIGEELVLA